ncbi:MAG: helix-turn-helix domain-containing protein [Jatrophihabitans sp.]
MRRTSLTPQQAQKLGEYLGARRMAMGLSMRQLAREVGGNISTISVIEAGTNLSPSPQTLKAIADVLGLSMSDIFVVADWLPADELPTLKPYLRAKYQDLDEQAIAELERYAERLAQRHGSLGPIDHEDEQP